MSSSQWETDIPGLLKELDRLANGTTDRLTAAVADVDNIINILQKARDEIADGNGFLPSCGCPYSFARPPKAPH